MPRQIKQRRLGKSLTQRQVRKRGIIGWCIPPMIAVPAFLPLVFGLPFAVYMIAPIGIAITYAAAYFTTAQSPDVFRVYAFDRMVGKVNAGWYMQIPGFFRLERVEMTWYDVQFQDLRAYVMDDKSGEPTYVSFTGYFQFRPLNTKTGLAQMLFMPPKDMEEQARQMSITRTHHAFGRQKVSEAIANIGDFEEELYKELKAECEQHGYEAGDFELNPKYPTVDTEAEGRARGRAAEALARPLKDNWPAAVVSATTVGADTLKDVVRKKRGSQRGAADASSSAASSGSLGDQIRQALDKVGGERLGRAIDSLNSGG